MSVFSRHFIRGCTFGKWHRIRPCKPVYRHTIMDHETGSLIQRFWCLYCLRMFMATISTRKDDQGRYYTHRSFEPVRDVYKVKLGQGMPRNAENIE